MLTGACMHVRMCVWWLCVTSEGDMVPYIRPSLLRCGMEQSDTTTLYSQAVHTCVDDICKANVPIL